MWENQWQDDNAIYTTIMEQGFNMPSRYEVDMLKRELKEAKEQAKTGKQYEFMRRIAIQAMEELERNELSDLVLLDNTELSKWWRKYKKDLAAEQNRLKKLEEKKLKEQQDAQLKAEVLARLSTEEKRVLGIK